MTTNNTDDIVIENDDPSNIIENENKNQDEVSIDYEVTKTLEGFNETNNEEEEQNNDVDEVPELVDDAELNKSKSNIEKVVQVDNTLKIPLPAGPIGLRFGDEPMRIIEVFDTSPLLKKFMLE